MGKGNIIGHGRKGRRRYKCKTCGKTFVASKGTAFYRLHKGALFVLVSTLLAFGCPPAAIVAAFRLDERTVYGWLERAGGQAQKVHQALILEQSQDLRQVQADEIRVRLQKRLVAWMALAICVPTRLWLGGVLSLQRDKTLIQTLAAQVKACALFAPLLLVSDGLAAYVQAWQKAFRTAVHTGRRARPLLLGWPVLIGQVLKHKENGRVLGVVQRLVQGSWEQARELLSTPQLNTAYIERLNATFRARLSSLVRRGRALARQTKTLEAGMYLLGTLYNLCTWHKSLRQERPEGRRKWQRRTPAMAAGLTDHRWTVEEMLAYRVPPSPMLLKRRPGRKPKHPSQLAPARCPT